jgi:hypothetical protein
VLDVVPDELLNVLGRIPSTESSPLEDLSFFVGLEMNVDGHVLGPLRPEVLFVSGYKGQPVIEKCFEQLKTEFELVPVYLR